MRHSRAPRAVQPADRVDNPLPQSSFLQPELPEEMNPVIMEIKAALHPQNPQDGASIWVLPLIEVDPRTSDRWDDIKNTVYLGGIYKRRKF